MKGIRRGLTWISGV